MAKKMILPDVVCKVEKSGNRYNAWSTDGVKYTSEITHGCRKNAFNGNYLIGRFPSTNGNSGFAWRRITDKVLASMENSVPNNTQKERAKSLDAALLLERRNNSISKPNINR